MLDWGRFLIFETIAKMGLILTTAEGIKFQERIKIDAKPIWADQLFDGSEVWMASMPSSTSSSSSLGQRSGQNSFCLELMTDVLSVSLTKTGRVLVQHSSNGQDVPRTGFCLKELHVQSLKPTNKGD